MTQRRWCNLFMAACASVLLTGCMPKMTIEEMKQMMPERPAELDLLNDFVGKWEGTTEMHFAGLEEPVKSTGTAEIKWDGDGWYLVERDKMNMEELGDMTGMGTWTYDTNKKIFRNVWVDSMGSLGVGTAKCDPETRTWRMKMTSYGPWGTSHAKGTAHFTDDDTIQWDYSESAMLGLVKTMTMTGTSKRVK